MNAILCQRTAQLPYAAPITRISDFWNEKRDLRHSQAHPTNRTASQPTTCDELSVSSPFPKLNIPRGLPSFWETAEPDLQYSRPASEYQPSRPVLPTCP